LVFDEIKTHQMSQHRILRSRTPDLVKQEICCAMRCVVISPAQRGEIGGISLDPMANPESKDKMGTIACQRTSGHAQANGVMR